jgi:DNA repair exonuclease SbcCD ATPase subunit
MRKLFFVSLVFPFAIACNQEVKEDNARLKTENEQLSKENQQQDSLINSFVADFTRIQENLATIREKEESIEQAREGGFEQSGNVRETVLKDVEAINELLSENRKTISDLNDNLKKYSYEVGKFKKMVANLNKEIDAKDAQVIELKENLATMNFEMSKLNSKLDTVTARSKMQQQLIEEQTESLNTAYYAVGNSKDLEANQVIDRKGGIIGIGRTKTVAEDFNRDYFTKIDITKTKVIPLDSDDDDVKLVSNHPSDSYKWNKTEDKVTSLEITNPDKFWKTSKYLVVLVD